MKNLIANICLFFQNEFTKIKEQENYHLVCNFVLFLLGITTCYFRLWVFAGIIAVLIFRNATRFVIFSLGFISMLVNFGIYNQTLITEKHDGVEVIATLESISHKEKSVKYTLSNVQNLSSNLPIEGKIMAYCRNCDGLDLQENSKVRGVLNIFPLPKKVYPTGYDIENKYRFLGYSAFTFIDDISQENIKKHNSENFFTNAVHIRTFFLKKLQNFADTYKIANEPLSIAEALFLGETSRISTQTNDILRASGLTHIISISGFHISIIVFLVYGFTVKFLALSSVARRNLNVKIPAMVFSLLFSFLYLAVAGMPIPGIRSFVMIFFGVVAAFFSVKPRCLAGVVFSGFALLVFVPHALFFASFQLSFLAILTLAMIIDNSWGVKNIFLRYCVGIVKSSFAITLVTAPVVLYHFGTVSLVNPLVNILAIPLFTFIIMPVGVLFFLLTITPFETTFLNIFLGKAMFESISKMISGSEYISNFEYSFVALKEIPLESVLLLICGILLMFLIKTVLKITGLILCVVGLLIFIYSKTPDIIANENSLVFRDSGQYYIISQKQEEFVQSIWRGKLGMKKDFLDGKKFCDENGVCIANKVTYIQKDANIANVPFLKCTDVLVSHIDVDTSLLQCKYKVVLTKESLTQQAFIVLKYNEVLVKTP